MVETVKWNSNGGKVKVEQWSEIGMVEESRWNSNDGTVKVEQ